jgi:hypothetical protein
MEKAGLYGVITPEEWLKKTGVGPDFISVNQEFASSLDFIHRETPSSHIYFISNKTSENLVTECIFRAQNAVPQIWDPTDGSVENQFVYQSNSDGISMPVNLPPGGSTFVVFKKGISKTGFKSFTSEKDAVIQDLPTEKILEAKKNAAVLECWQNGKYSIERKNRNQIQTVVDNIPLPQVINGAWDVEFDPNWGAPERVVFPELISWTEHENQGIKYYSGKGTYTKTITVQEDWIGEGKKISLGLGKVGEVAEVFINGKPAGVLWKPPFRIDITALVSPGANELKVEVMNLWINRLTGDANLPERERFTKTNIRSDGGSWLANYSEWHVEPSGLFGPVRLLSSHIVEIKN